MPIPPLVAKLVSHNLGEHQSTGLLVVVIARGTVAQSLRFWAMVVAVITMVMMVVKMMMDVIGGFYVPWTYLRMVIILVPHIMLEHEHDIENQSDLC